MNTHMPLPQRTISEKNEGGPVTDDNSRGGGRIISCNTENPFSASIAAWIAEHGRWDWHEARIPKPQCCGKCERELEPNEPVGFWRIYRRGRPHWKYLCGECAPNMEAHENAPCDTCGRRVYWQRASRGGMRQRAFCSKRCRWTFYNEKTKEKRQQALGKICEDCGNPFTASRSDSRHCSDACRQMSYRRRGKGRGRSREKSSLGDQRGQR